MIPPRYRREEEEEEDEKKRKSRRKEKERKVIERGNEIKKKMIESVLWHFHFLSFMSFLTLFPFFYPEVVSRNETARATQTRVKVAC